MLKFLKSWAFCIATPGLIAGTIRVPADQPTIQAAINSAANGDDILVAAGTYHERINFNGKSIRLHSASGPQATTLDGGGGGAVVTFANNEDAGAIIDGFTIQNGGPNQGGLDEGGGVSVEGAAPTIQNNVIQDNHVGYAGGGIGIGFGSPTILNNVIQRNSQNNGIGGGGISVRGGTAVIKGNTIVDNQAAAFGGGLSFWASGQTTIVNNIIMRNRGQDAGGIAFVNGGVPVIQQNLIVGNIGTGAGGISGPMGTILNNTIADNNGPQGSAIGGFFGPDVVIENNIMQAPAGQTPVQCGGNGAQPRNNLFYAPGGQLGSSACPGLSGNGNIVADPLFICPTGGNYRLQPGSPAIDAGDGSVNAPSSDLDGAPRVVAGKAQGKSTIDIGAYEFQGASALAVSGSALTFPDQLVGTSSAAQAVTISNTGGRRGSFCIQLAAADFQMSTNCSNGLDPSASCSVQVKFNPLRDGSRTGMLTIPSDSLNSPATVALSGTGLNPAPTLTSIAPKNAVVNGPAFTLQAIGSGFVAESVVQWNGKNLATSFVSGTVLTAAVASGDLATIGTTQLKVVNPAPGGGTTSTLDFTIVGPSVAPAGLLNGANYKAQLSAGSYAALFGSSMASSTASAQSVPLPTTLASVSVLMNGFAAPLFFVSPTQINLQVPWELSGTNQIEVVVTTNGVSATPINVVLSPLAPGLLSTNAQGTGQGVIIVAGTDQIASPARPVNRTEAVSIYCVGLGLVSEAPASGSPASLTALARAINTPTVEFGGVPGKVLFAGLAPGLIGIYQVNVQLPLNAPAGSSVPVVLKAGSIASNTVTIAVQ
jgi:uncharacterized protein (TIGR03437 family)